MRSRCCARGSIKAQSGPRACRSLRHRARNNRDRSRYPHRGLKMSYRMRCGRCAAETPRFQSYEEVSQVAIRAGYVSAGVTYGYPDGNHAWFRSLVLCPACANALSVMEVVKLLDNPALCSGLLIDE